MADTPILNKDGTVRKKAGRPKGIISPLFGRVERAREAMVAQAEEYVRLHIKGARIAAAKGNTAASEWALSHIAEMNAQGAEQRPIAASADRQTIESGGSKVQIMIGAGWGPQVPGALIPSVHVNSVPLKELPLDTPIVNEIEGSLTLSLNTEQE